MKTPTIFLVGAEDPRHRLFKLQIEMEWFEKHIHGRAYAWEKSPVVETKDAPKATTAAGQVY